MVGLGLGLRLGFGFGFGLGQAACVGWIAAHVVHVAAADERALPSPSPNPNPNPNPNHGCGGRCIVEPVQAEGGDNHASPAFFRRLQALCIKHEVHSGGFFSTCRALRQTGDSFGGMLQGCR